MKKNINTNTKMKNSSKVIDSFSTAHLEYYCGTYVSVGAGNSGHIGGITAIMEGTSSEITRSHYAGTTKSQQYNAVLVIPIIQNNINKYNDCGFGVCTYKNVFTYCFKLIQLVSNNYFYLLGKDHCSSKLLHHYLYSFQIFLQY